MANQIVSILLGSATFELEEDFLNEVFIKGTSTKDLIQLLIGQLDYLTHTNITKLLSNLPYPYSEISINGRRPQLEKGSRNEALVMKLKQRNYISSYKFETTPMDEKRIRVNTRRL